MFKVALLSKTVRFFSKVLISILHCEIGLLYEKVRWFVSGVTRVWLFHVVNSFQDFDKDPFGSSSDPFGDKKDPFADKGDPFGSTDKGADVFASPEEKKDPFGASDSDPFGEAKPASQADPFAQKTQVRVSARNSP